VGATNGGELVVTRKILRGERGVGHGTTEVPRRPAQPRAVFRPPGGPCPVRRCL